MNAPYTSNDPRLAPERIEQCEEGAFTKQRCTATAVAECVSCRSDICEEHSRRCSGCLRTICSDCEVVVSGSGGTYSLCERCRDAMAPGVAA
jgi:hypothetical protein